jgi:hypothetical protein
MADLKLYSNAEFFVNGTFLAEEASVTMSKRSGLSPVFTMGNGFAGMSQGVPTIEITVESAVPSADLEFNPDSYMLIGEVVEVRLVMANRESNIKGFCTEASYSHSVNDASKLSMTFMCRFGEFE